MVTRQSHGSLSHQATRHRIAAHGACACLMLLALVIAGCGTSPLSPAGGSHSSTVVSTTHNSDAAPSPVVLHDPAPGTLNVSMWVNVEQVTGDAQLMADVGLSFSQGEQIVQFAGNERVTCNGADLALKNRAATFQILHAPVTQAAGTTMRCDYTAAGGVASISLRIPSPPAITAPHSGAQIARGMQTLITYRFDSTTGSMMGIVALAVPTSAQPKAIAKLNTPGPLQATVDTSHFAPGPGSVVITASLAPHIVSSGLSFKSMNAGGSVMATTAVTWV